MSRHWALRTWVPLAPFLIVLYEVYVVLQPDAASAGAVDAAVTEKVSATPDTVAATALRYLCMRVNSPLELSQTWMCPDVVGETVPRCADIPGRLGDVIKSRH